MEQDEGERSESDRGELPLRRRALRGGGTRSRPGGGCGPTRTDGDTAAHGLQATYCHCSYCRKNGGGAFSANLGVARDGFRVTHGKALLGSYDSSPGKTRYFCTRCGSPLFHTKAADPKTVTIKMGSIDRFDEYDGKLPTRHIFEESAADAPWLEGACERQ